MAALMKWPLRIAEQTVQTSQDKCKLPTVRKELGKVCQPGCSEKQMPRQDSACKDFVRANACGKENGEGAKATGSSGTKANVREVTMLS